MRLQITKPEIKKHRVELPSSKSQTHRALFLAAINREPTNILRASTCDDTLATFRALKSLGADFTELNFNKTSCRHPIGKIISEEIDCWESGTTARLILPMCTAGDRPVLLDGAPGLRRRPFKPLLKALRQLGGKLEETAEGLPLRIYPSQLEGGNIEFGGIPSSQFISALLLAAPLMSNPLEISWTQPPPSFPYIQQTIRLMRKAGLKLEESPHSVWADNRPLSRPLTFRIEPDYSAVAFWGVLALITGMEIELPGVVRSGLQGDEVILDILAEVGGKIRTENRAVTISGEIVRPLDIDCRNTPDLAPALAVLALFAPAPSTLRHITHLRVKESDRIAAIQKNIASLGGNSELVEQDLIIRPTRNYTPAVIDSFNDHRIAMSFAVAGTRVPGVVVSRAECVRKSYPNFWQDFPWWREL